MKKEKEVNEKYLKEIYQNVLKAIVIVLYFFILNISYENVDSTHLELGIKILTMMFLFISIYIFERAYKKDSGSIAIQGIEILILSAYTLTTEHITNKFDFNFKNYSLVASYLFAIYFILKSIVVYTKGRKEEEQELNDIKEIVRKTEPTKKEATKKVKENEYSTPVKRRKTTNSKNDEISKTNTIKKKPSNTKRETSTVNTTTKKKSAINKTDGELKVSTKKKTNNAKIDGELKESTKKKTDSAKINDESKTVTRKRTITSSKVNNVEKVPNSRKKTTGSKKEDITDIKTPGKKKTTSSTTKTKKKTTNKESESKKRVKKEVTEND